MIEINLHDVQDELEGNWWLHIRIADFGFKEHIGYKELETYPVDDGDVLIHKFRPEGERFPKVKYHLIDTQATPPVLELDGKIIREQMATRLIDYITKYKKLPYACEFGKEFKNGGVQIDYKPTTFDSFALKIDPEMMEPDLLGQIKTFSTNSVNSLSTSDTTQSIKPIRNAADLEQIAAESPEGKDSVCVFGAEILAIDKRESTFQEHVSIYYLIHIIGGEAASDTKKSTLHRPFNEINIRISDNLFEKTPIKVGDKISFKGKLKKDKALGVVLQNIMKITVDA
jgi:hypothetical protein